MPINNKSNLLSAVDLEDEVPLLMLSPTTDSKQTQTTFDLALNTPDLACEHSRQFLESLISTDKYGPAVKHLLKQVDIARKSKGMSAEKLDAFIISTAKVFTDQDYTRQHYLDDINHLSKKKNQALFVAGVIVLFIGITLTALAISARMGLLVSPDSNETVILQYHLSYLLGNLGGVGLVSGGACLFFAQGHPLNHGAQKLANLSVSYKQEEAEQEDDLAFPFADEADQDTCSYSSLTNLGTI